MVRFRVLCRQPGAPGRREFRLTQARQRSVSYCLTGFLRKLTWRTEEPRALILFVQIIPIIDAVHISIAWPVRNFGSRETMAFEGQVTSDDIDNSKAWKSLC